MGTTSIEPPIDNYRGPFVTPWCNLIFPRRTISTSVPSPFHPTHSYLPYGFLTIDFLRLSAVLTCHSKKAFGPFSVLFSLCGKFLLRDRSVSLFKLTCKNWQILISHTAILIASTFDRKISPSVLSVC
ncbi:hypothetical protein RvY_02622 [Ramazzottius varieornatus]|uniref:Uncharacterized protein n=1 Tax=Ramazzottius varieornatus TaxID=947166 RepID=A0A1D1UP39_RAMVA|nr:hypothetical protein RvY_02622 [Ramazzottius varieornatus]